MQLTSLRRGGKNRRLVRNYAVKWKGSDDTIPGAGDGGDLLHELIECTVYEARRLSGGVPWAVMKHKRNGPGPSAIGGTQRCRNQIAPVQCLVIFGSAQPLRRGAIDKRMVHVDWSYHNGEKSPGRQPARASLWLVETIRHMGRGRAAIRCGKVFESPQTVNVYNGGVG